MTTQKTTGEHPVRGDSDAQLTAYRQDLVLDPTGQQRVLDLKIGYRMDSVRTTDRLGPGLRQPDVPNVSGLHHLRDRTDRLLSWYRRIHPPQAVHIDIVGTEPTQRICQRALYGRRPPVDTDDLPVRSSEQPKLDANRDAAAVAATQRLADQQFVVASA